MLTKFSPPYFQGGVSEGRGGWASTPTTTTRKKYPSLRAAWREEASEARRGEATGSYKRSQLPN